MANKLSIGLCDDEAVVRETCREIITRLLGSKYDLTFREFTSGKELTFELADSGAQPDILFLDICMPQMDGMETALRLRNRFGFGGALVFLTIDRDKVFKAFDVDAVYYLLKDNMTAAQFSTVLDKALEYLDFRSAKSSIAFSCVGEERVIALEDIHWFEVNHRIVRVHYGDGESFEFYSSMQKLNDRMQDLGFVRCHRSYVVALDDIMRLSSREIETYEGEVIPVGGTYAESVKQAMDSSSTVVIGGK